MGEPEIMSLSRELKIKFAETIENKKTQNMIKLLKNPPFYFVI
jgi:hypothetical protein